MAAAKPHFFWEDHQDEENLEDIDEEADDGK
jgi:hypothetical protein